MCCLTHALYSLAVLAFHGSPRSQTEVRVSNGEQRESVRARAKRESFIRNLQMMRKSGTCCFTHVDVLFDARTIFACIVSPIVPRCPFLSVSLFLGL
jgi:hypothetical protein